MPPTDVSRLLQEIFVTENEAEIDVIAKRAAKVVASLPPRQRDLANEKLQDAIRERREAWRT